MALLPRRDTCGNGKKYHIIISLVLFKMFLLLFKFRKLSVFKPGHIRVLLSRRETMRKKAHERIHFFPIAVQKYNILWVDPLKRGHLSHSRDFN